jgi:hypothetical protein
MQDITKRPSADLGKPGKPAAVNNAPGAHAAPRNHKLGPLIPE